MNATDLKLYLVTHRYDDNEATFWLKSRLLVKVASDGAITRKDAEHSSLF